MRKRIRSIAAAVALTLALAIFAAVPGSRADERNQATQFTFDRDVRVPGMILPAGTYWFQVLDGSGSKDVVQIFNFDRTEVVTTVMTSSAERLEPHGKTILTLTDTEGTNAVPAMLTWFYPGRTIGHHFVYSTALQNELDTEPTVELVVGESGPTYMRVNGYQEYPQDVYPRQTNPQEASPAQPAQQPQAQPDQEQPQAEPNQQPPQQYPGAEPQDQQPPDQQQQPPDQQPNYPE